MTAEGFPLAILMGKGEVEKLELSAALASLGSLSEQTASKLGIGKYKDMILRSSRGHLLVRRISDSNILAVLTEKSAQLGACYIVVDALAKRLHRMLK
jgi:predicted regulator of Ras-like GTPase activity (Roadblock/LC7/MglB family)